MNKFIRKALLLALGLAILGVFSLGGPQGAKADPPVNLDMGIDPEITGNSCGPSTYPASGCTLGTVELCKSYMGLTLDDGNADFQIDVYVEAPGAGEAPAPVAYDAYVKYTAGSLRITAADGKIKMPGADIPGMEAIPVGGSIDGVFDSGWLFLNGATGAYPNAGVNTYIGDGPLSRLDVDCRVAGVVDLEFDAPAAAAAYASEGAGGYPNKDIHNITRRTAKVACNAACPAPEVDITVDSTVTGWPADSAGDPAKGDMDVSETVNVQIKTAATHTGTPLPNTVEVRITHSITAPSGCDVNGGASWSNTRDINIANGATECLPGPESGTCTSTDTVALHCDEPSDHLFEFLNTADVIEPGWSDPTPASETESETIEVWSYADIDITSFTMTNATPKSPATEGAYYDAGTWYLDVSVDVIVEVTKELTISPDPANSAAYYTPIAVALSKTVGVTAGPGDATVDPMSDTEQVSADDGVNPGHKEYFTVHCTAEGTVTITINNKVSVAAKDPHVEEVDKDLVGTDLVLPIECVPPFDPGFAWTISDDTAGEQATLPTDDICVLHAVCEMKTDLSIPNGQPLAEKMRSWYPDAFDFVPSTSLTNEIKVGNITFQIEIESTTPYICPDGELKGGGALLADACLPPSSHAPEVSTPLAFAVAASGGPTNLFVAAGKGALFSVGDGVIIGNPTTGSPGAEWNTIVAITMGAGPGGTDVITIPLPNAAHLAGDALAHGIHTAHPDEDTCAVDAVGPGNPSGKAFLGGIDALFPSWTGGSADTSWSSVLDYIVQDVDELNGVSHDGFPVLHNRFVGYIVALTMPVNIVVFDARDSTADQMDCDDDGDCDNDSVPYAPENGWLSVTEPGTGTVPTGVVTCSPLDAFLLILGESEDNPYVGGTQPVETLRTCVTFGTHTAKGTFQREDTLEWRERTDTASCIETKTDLEVTLIKDEEITVPEDLEHTETVNVVVYNNGAAPTNYTVDLWQVSTKTTKCITHLLPEAGDTLNEFTVGNQFYSNLKWTDYVDAWDTDTHVRDYTVLCTEPSIPPDHFSNIEQFTVTVDPIATGGLDMEETDEPDNTAENHVSVVSDPDIDDDTVPNEQDNCPSTANPGQEDEDGDDQGNACDPDKDGDKIPDKNEVLEKVNPDAQGKTRTWRVKLVQGNKDELGKDLHLKFSDKLYKVVQKDGWNWKIDSHNPGEPAMNEQGECGAHADDDYLHLANRTLVFGQQTDVEIRLCNKVASLTVVEKHWTKDGNLTKNQAQWQEFDVALDECPNNPGDPESPPGDNHGCPETDISITVLKDETPVLYTSEDTPYAVQVTVTNNDGVHSADVDVDLLLVSEDPAAGVDCTIDWDGPQDGLSYVSEVIAGKLHSLLSSADNPITLGPGASKVYNLTATLHCFERSDHPDAFELAAGAAPVPPTWDDTPANNIEKNWPDPEVWDKTDLKKQSLSVITPVDFGNINAQQTTTLTVRQVVHNNGPTSPVDAKDTLVVNAPPDCLVQVDGGGFGPSATFNWWPFLTQSVSAAYEKDFDIFCEHASTHVFTIDNTIIPTTPHVEDTDDSNDSKSITLTVHAIAQTDPYVVVVNAAAPASANVDTNFTVDCAISGDNNGWYDPANVDVTLSLTVPPDCDKDHGDLVTQDVAAGVFNIGESWTVQCHTFSSHTFTCDGSLVLDETHVEDTDLGNNSDSGTDTTLIYADADIQINSWTFPDEIVHRAGNQVIVGPVLPAGSGWEAINSTEELENLGPYSPVAVHVDLTTNGDPPACDVEPNTDTYDVSLAVGSPDSRAENYQVRWYQVSKPPYTCTINFEKDITVPDHVTNIGDTNMVVPVEVVRDADGDGIPDDGDFSGDPNDHPCDTGEGVEAACDDNCQDDYNPTQLDADDDGMGEACDSEDFHDDGVKKMIIFGPAPLNLSDTTGRYMWVIGEIGNFTTHMDEVVLSLTIDGAPAGCDEDIQLILPGSNHFYLLDNEQKWVLYRVRYECHQPADTGIYPLDLELCVDHQDQTTGDDQNTANDCKQGTRSLLIEEPIPSGSPIVSITHDVTDDCDSGFAPPSPNWWALNNYLKSVDIWDLGGGNFYVVSDYAGTATTIVGADPPGAGDDADFTAAFDATMNGGYHLTFTGTFLGGGSCDATSGYTGVKDYGDGTCPVTTPFDLLGCYFSGAAGYTYVDWGWQYDAGDAPDCEWTNADAGSSGNILDSCQ